MDNSIIVSRAEKVRGFCWQHFLLLISLYTMTLGVALCVRSQMGSSVISSLPMAFSLAGEDNLVGRLSIGDYTNIMNIILVVAQILVLRKRFERVQLFQLCIGFVFGSLIDLNMGLTSGLDCSELPMQAAAQFAGCTVMAFGIAMEVRCGSVTMPGEGFPVAISRVTGRPFPKIKIMVDVSLVALAVASCYCFWGRWRWDIIGVGTMFAMFYVGFMVKQFSRRMGWFDSLLCYRPGMRRYVYGLARYIYTRFNRQ